MPCKRILRSYIKFFNLFSYARAHFFPRNLIFRYLFPSLFLKLFLSYRKGADGKYLFLEISIGRLNCSLVGCLNITSTKSWEGNVKNPVPRIVWKLKGILRNSEMNETVTTAKNRNFQTIFAFWNRYFTENSHQVPLINNKLSGRKAGSSSTRFLLAVTDLHPQLLNSLLILLQAAV